MAVCRLAFLALAIAPCIAASCSSFSEADPTDVGAVPDAAADVILTGETGRADAASAFSVLASNYSNLRDVVADEQWAYVAEQSPGGVHAIPLPGNPQQAVTSHTPAPTALAVSGNTLFWFDNNDSSLHTWVPSTGTTSVNPELRPLGALALSGPLLVVLIQKDDTTGAGGAIQVRPQSALDTLDNRVGSVTPFDLAVRGNDAFWTDSQGIRHLPIDDTEAVADMFAPCPDSDCEYIATDESSVYWTQPMSNAVAGKTGTGPSVVLSAPEVGISALAADATGVYWIVADGKLRRWTRNDDTTLTLSDGFIPLPDLNARSLALTSKYVIWLTGDGRVLRYSK